MSKRLAKDFEAIQKHHKETFTVEMPTKDIKFWIVKFKGAPKTLYAGEEFKYHIFLELPPFSTFSSCPLFEDSNSDSALNT